MKTFKNFGVALNEAPQPYDTGDSVELAVATYNNLGLVADEGNARESFGKAVNALQSMLPESVTAQPHDIVMVPKLGELSLSDLIGRYNEFSPHSQTYAWDNLLDRYTAEELNQGQTRPIQAQAVLLGGENKYDEPGLYFTNQRLKKQRQSLKQAQQEHDGKDTELSAVSLASYIVRNAMQLERDEQPQDKSTETRFIGLDSKRVGVFSFVPAANSDVNGLILNESCAVKCDDEGVRLSVSKILRI